MSKVIVFELLTLDGVMQAVRPTNLRGLLCRLAQANR